MAVVKNKKIIEITNKTSISDTDLLLVGDNGTDTMRTINWGDATEEISASLSSLRENLSNPNILINGDFQVWQRGTSFNNSIATNSYVIYTADRWWTNNEGSNFTISKGGTGGIVLSATQGLYQTLETPLEIGETYTLSAKINGEIIKFSFIGGTPSMTDHLEYFKWGEFDCVQIRGKATEQTVNWAKLEKGSIATPFVSRPYVEELAMCERYYQYYEESCLWSRNNTDFNGFPLRTEMRTTPSVANGYYMSSNGDNVQSKVNYISLTKNFFRYIIFSESVGNIAYVTLNLDAEIY